DHLRFLDGPGRHRLVPLRVLGDHRLEDDQPEARAGGFLDLRAIQGELTGGLAPGIAERQPGIGCGHVQAVSLAQIAVEVLGQSLARKAIVVLADLAGHGRRDIGDPREEMGTWVLHQSSLVGSRAPTRARHAPRRSNSAGSSAGPQGSWAASSGITPWWTRHQSIRRM